MSRYIVTFTQGETQDRIFVESERTPEMDLHVRNLAAGRHNDILKKLPRTPPVKVDGEWAEGPPPKGPVMTVEYETETTTTTTVTV